MLGCESQIKEPINKKNHALHNTQVTRFHSDISLDLGFQAILIPFHTRNYHSFGVSWDRRCWPWCRWGRWYRLWRCRRCSVSPGRADFSQGTLFPLSRGSFSGLYYFPQRCWSRPQSCDSLQANWAVHGNFLTWNLPKKQHAGAKSKSKIYASILHYKFIEHVTIQEWTNWWDSTFWISPWLRVIFSRGDLSSWSWGCPGCLLPSWWPPLAWPPSPAVTTRPQGTLSSWSAKGWDRNFKLLTSVIGNPFGEISFFFSLFLHQLYVLVTKFQGFLDLR